MDGDSNEKKMLIALKNVKNKTTGLQKHAIEYQINQLENKIENKFKGNVFQSRVSKKRIEAKIEYEKDNLRCYNRYMEVDSTMTAKLLPKKDIALKKLYFLEKARSNAYESEEEVYYTGTTGSVSFKINQISVNPIFKCTKIDFIVDTDVKISINYDYKKEFVIELANNKEFEIIVYGENDMILSLIFFPCEYLTKHVDYKNEKINFENGYIDTQIKFEKEAKLLRKNAEIVCIVRFGHSLENFSCMSIFYCCVCNQLGSIFVPAYRCYKCKFTCHKQCANYILFNCKCSAEEKTENYTKRYAISHVLIKKTSFGIKWCSHCGCRISTQKDSYKCSNCNIYLHSECAARVFNSCGITYDLRCAMADFKPPPLVAKPTESKLSIDDFSFVKVLGRGSFGKVILAKDKNNTILALKILKKESLVDSNEITYIEYERRVLAFSSSSNHPFLMEMLYCFQDSKHIYFGTEFVSGGDLFHHAAKGNFTNQQIKLYTCEILMGLEFLHKNDIIYRDMKLDNILITADGHVKIADFGLCKDNFKSFSTTFTYCGTADTIAPEVILQVGYTKDVDWWSFGVVIYEMYENAQPFNGATNAEIASEILHSEVTFKKTPKKAQDLISKLLTKNPLKRLGYGPADGELIRQHPYFDGIVWDDVYNKKYTPPFVPGDSLTANFDKDFIDEPINLTPCNTKIEYDRFFTNFK
ncbi:Serine/threonine kinase [Binucleata daphniae]